MGVVVRGRSRSTPSPALPSRGREGRTRTPWLSEQRHQGHSAGSKPPRAKGRAGGCRGAAAGSMQPLPRGGGWVGGELTTHSASFPRRRESTWDVFTTIWWLFRHLRMGPRFRGGDIGGGAAVVKGREIAHPHLASPGRGRDRSSVPRGWSKLDAAPPPAGGGGWVGAVNSQHTRCHSREGRNPA